jgi:hypothetical protein
VPVRTQISDFDFRIFFRLHSSENAIELHHKEPAMHRTLWLGLAVVFAFFSNNPLWAQTVLTADFSPQAVGRAGVYTSSATDDPLAAIANPALLGLQADRNRFMAAFYPAPATWNSDWHDAPGYTARAAHVGFNRNFLHSYFRWTTPLSFGIGYQESYLNLHKINWTDEQGHFIGSSDAYERSQGINLAAALHHKYWQLALGLSYRFSALKYVSVQADHAASANFGVYFQSPLDQLIPRNNPVVDDGAISLRPVCTAGFSYVFANVGPSYTAHPTRDDPTTLRQALPRTAKMGLNLSGGLRAFRGPRDSLDLMSFGMGIEATDLLVKDYQYPAYQNPIGNIHPVSTLLFGKGEVGVSLHKGFEAGLLEALYYRWGNMSGEDGISWPVYSGTTEGFGIRLSGLLKIMSHSSDFPHGKVTDAIARHFDLQYDQSTVHVPSSTADGMTNKQFSLLWRY